MAMISTAVPAILFWLLLSGAMSGEPKVTQSMVIDFPVNGQVKVEVREEIGKSPQIAFIAQTTGRVLLFSSIEDHQKLLIPQSNQEEPPILRFGLISSSGFFGPIVMSVGLFRGVSDNAYFLTMFGEVDGNIVRLNSEPFCTNLQGGYYFGDLSDKFGYGLAVWNAVWEVGVEPHYGAHKYKIEIYRVLGEKLVRVFENVSNEKYNEDTGVNALRELGIRGTDQRTGIPVIKDSLEKDP